MDVLKVLATKNNAVGETVVSSFLNYFLDPIADHGLGGGLPRTGFLASAHSSCQFALKVDNYRTVRYIRTVR